MTTRVLVTGASGYIGGHVVGMLGQEDVQLITAGATSVSVDHRVDLTDRRSCMGLIEEAQPNVIVHLAGGPRSDSAETYSANVLCATNVFEAAAEVGALRVISIGSAAEYGAAGSDLCGEDGPTHPINPYGRAKLAQTEIGRWYRSTRNIDIVTLRPFNIYGPRMAPTTALGNLAHQLAKADASDVRLGRLDIVRDWTPIGLVGRAIVRAVVDPPPYDIVNVCTGNGLSLADVVGAALRIDGRGLAVSSNAGLTEIAAHNSVVGSVERLQSWLGPISQPSAEDVAGAILGRPSASSSRSM